MNSQIVDLLKIYRNEEINILNFLPYDAIASAIKLIRMSFEQNRHIFIFGNGGSASNASHMAMEIGKNAAKVYDRIRVISLNDNIAWMTAIANDQGFENIFLHQLKSLSIIDDMAIVMSTSGKSPNIFKATHWAKTSGLKIITITGNAPNSLVPLADVPIVIPSMDAGHIENMQQIILHMIIYVCQKWEELKQITENIQ